MSDNFSGNKGEWSEVYTLIKLLGQEKLFAADENLEKVDNIFFFVKEIIREEVDNKRQYISNGKIKIIDSSTEKIIKEIPKNIFLKKSISLYKGIKEGSGRSFKIPEIESFLSEIDVNKLKAPSTSTADIHIKIHDPRTELQPKLGYSIKSLIGGNSTLFNPGKGTNFLYKIELQNSMDIKGFNKKTYKLRSKLNYRVNELLSLGAKIHFHSIESDSLFKNLLLIDSDLPQIVSQLLLFRYLQNESNLSKLVDILEKENPLQYPDDSDRLFYNYKIKKLLRDMAMGMTAESPWTGNFDASGGTLVVREDGEIVCYHVYDIQKFEEYLLKNTYLETPSTGEDKQNPGNPKSKHTGKNYNFGWIYEENKEVYFKLNLQVRYSG